MTWTTTNGSFSPTEKVTTKRGDLNGTCVYWDNVASSNGNAPSGSVVASVTYKLSDNSFRTISTNTVTQKIKTLKGVIPPGITSGISSNALPFGTISPAIRYNHRKHVYLLSLYLLKNRNGVVSSTDTTPFFYFSAGIKEYLGSPPGFGMVFWEAGMLPLVSRVNASRIWVVFGQVAQRWLNVVWKSLVLGLLIWIFIPVYIWRLLRLYTISRFCV